MKNNKHCNGKTLYLECYSGISGDMTVAALLDLGADKDVLLEGLKSLNVDGYEIEISRAEKCSIDACDFNVILDSEKDQDGHGHGVQHGHHGHHHEHHHGHHHEHCHNEQEHGHSYGDNLDQAHSHNGEHDHEHSHKDEHDHEHSHNDDIDHGHSHEEKLEVKATELNTQAHTHTHVNAHTHLGHHDHSHTNAHTHLSHHNHSHTNAHIHLGHHDHRNLYDINKIIDDSAITENAKNIAKKIFQIVATAESKAHGKSISEVHFHEVGAVDSIVDIVSAAICLDNLNIKDVIVSELYEGTGHVRCQHGTLPVPVPAVTNIAIDHKLTLHLTSIKSELITPTGAAIVAAIKTKERLPKKFNILKLGLGAGKREYEQAAILRAMIIEEVQ